MGLIQGTAIRLAVRTADGVDALNNPVYALSWVTVENVLVGQPTTEEIRDALSLDGRRLAYYLGIPKGDTHEWRGCEVEVFGRRYRGFGDVIEGVEANVPGPWHKKVQVERIE